MAKANMLQRQGVRVKSPTLSRNQKEILKNVGIGILILAVIAFAMFWISVPVWVLTHHYHWTAFTRWLFDLTYAVITIAVIIGIVAAVDA